MLRSAWLLAVGAVLTVWYAGKVYLLSYFGTKEAVSRSCHPAARGWARAILRLAGVRVRVEGVDNLDPDGAMIIVSNHESWFDVWALAGWLPIDARFLAKKELSRIPVFGRAWRVCGHISIDRGDLASAIESLTRAGQQIRDENLHMVLFAEGTRSANGELQPFKKGPFVLAIQGGVPIVPVAIIGTRPLMPKGSFRIGRGEILVRVGEPIDVTGMEHADRDRLTQMARDAVVELRGGEGRTSSLPGEEPVEAVLESPGSSPNRDVGLEGLRPLDEKRIGRVSDH